MNNGDTTCPGCGAASSPKDVLPYDGYFNTTPECWAMFTEVCGREFGDAVIFGAVHQLTVDTYAVQHAGGPHPDKSICIHLCGLHLVHERGFKSPAVAPILQRIANGMAQWPHYDPPANCGELTIVDVIADASPHAHIAVVETWSKQVWRTWSEHHDAIKALIDGLGVSS